MKFTPPYRVSKNWNGIVSILDAAGSVVSEIYPGQQYDAALNTRVAPTPQECMDVAQSLVDRFNAGVAS